MKEFKKKAPGFKRPVMVPGSAHERDAWQEANRDWWEKNPMRYDWLESVSYREFSKEFFQEIDRRFFENADDFATRHGRHFDRFIDFNAIEGKDVLEIGVGMGSHAQLLTQAAKSYTGIDLTAYAVKSTTERLRALHLNGKVLQMDAEKMSFPDGSFDYVWSWGVIHHSSNTRSILSEIKRVLRPGGKATIMVYYRSWWSYYMVGLLRGLVSGNIFKTRSLSKSVQLYTDGALARYYSFRDWKKEVSPYFSVRRLYSIGPKTDILPLPGGFVKDTLKKLIPAWFNNFLTTNLCMGVFLFSVIEKK